MDLQPIEDDRSCQSLFPEFNAFMPLKPGSHRKLAALKLIEEGKLELEHPVSDYFPEFANLVMIDDQMAPHWTYKPAQTVMTVKHLLHHTSGLFYPIRDIKFDQQMDAYAAPHDGDDPVSEFISLVKVNVN